MARNPFRQLDVIWNASQKGRTIKDCYRLLYNKALWRKAYTNLCLLEGEFEKKTADKSIDEMIEQLKAGIFRFSSLRDDTVKIHRKNQLNFRGKLVQEIIRMILDHVYEPVFSNNSHGFRKGKSCHTALSQIKSTWNELTWCIKGDNIGFFHCINHTILMKLLSKKIVDTRFLLLIHNALKCGVMENWKYNRTYSGTPQGSAITLLLTNIYFHELDLFMEKQMKTFNVNQSKASKVNQASRPAMYHRLEYVRYANTFVIGISGRKKHVLKIKKLVESFLQQELALALKEEALTIRHLENPVPFLGYQLRLSQKGKARNVASKTHKQSYKKSSVRETGSIQLEIPKKKIHEFALTYNYGDLNDFKITHRTRLVNYSEIHIMNIYNAELQGFANYYKLANNYHYLGKLFYLAESSFIKTIANKRRSTSKKVTIHLRKYLQGAICVVHCDEKGNEINYSFVRMKDMPKAKKPMKVDYTYPDIIYVRLLWNRCNAAEGSKHIRYRASKSG